MSTVDGPTRSGGAYGRRLDDGVELRVGSPADFMPFSRRNIQQRAEASDLSAMRKALGGAIISCADNMAVQNDHRTDPASGTGASGCGDTGHHHEVNIPFRSSYDLVPPSAAEHLRL